MRSHSTLTLALTIALLFLDGAPIVRAQGCEPNILPPHSVVHGRTVGEWAGEWWSWALSIPTGRNPVVADDGKFCHEGQSGPVFFLAGNFGEETERVCEVPVPCGKWILVAISNIITWIPLDCVQFPQCRAFVEEFEDLVSVLECEVDGQSIPNLGDYREESPPFEFTVPEDSPFGLPPGTYEDAVTDGYWLMLEPLCEGEHTIRAKAVVGPPEDPIFWLEVTHTFEVSPCGTLRRGDANVDGRLNISDPGRILARLFRGASPFPCEDAADGNDDGRIDLTDAVFLLEYLFRNGPPLPPPGPLECGEDPTADDLAECSATCA